MKITFLNSSMAKSDSFYLQSLGMYKMKNLTQYPGADINIQRVLNSSIPSVAKGILGMRLIKHYLPLPDKYRLYTIYVYSCLIRIYIR